MEAPATRARIVETATRVLVTNRGASTGEIAAAAGVGRTTLHRHFPSRADLVRAVGMAALDAAAAATLPGSDGSGADDAAPRDVLQRLAEALTPVVPQLQFLLAEAALATDPQVVQRTEEVLAPLRALMERARAEGVIRLDVPAAWVVDAFFGLLLTAWEGVSLGTIAPRAAPTLVVGTLLDGVGAQEG